MKVTKLLTFTAPLLLYGATAFAATSGTGLDTFATTIETVMSGPVALLIALLVLVAAAGLLAVARNFEHGFQTLLAGGAGVALLATAAITIPLLWANAGALIS